MKFAPIVFGDHNDPPDFARWTGKSDQEKRIERFTKKDDSLAILIVKSMLLRGFDAPNTQALYLDRLIQEAELLQAIAADPDHRPGVQRPHAWHHQRAGDRVGDGTRSASPHP